MVDTVGMDRVEEVPPERRHPEVERLGRGSQCRPRGMAGRTQPGEMLVHDIATRVACDAVIRIALDLAERKLVVGHGLQDGAHRGRPARTSPPTLSAGPWAERLRQPNAAAS